MNPTTAFDRLMKRAFHTMFPDGRSQVYFPPSDTPAGYRRAVVPDFVLPDGRWVDFKLAVSFRESSGPAWRPSALYASLRKYLDHSANPDGRLIVVYGRLFGTLGDVDFPICRGRKTLIRNAQEFIGRISLVSAQRGIGRLAGGRDEWMIDELDRILRQ